MILFLFFSLFFSPKDSDKSASESLVAIESENQSIDEVKKRIKSLKIDRENDDGKNRLYYRFILTSFTSFGKV